MLYGQGEQIVEDPNVALHSSHCTLEQFQWTGTMDTFGPIPRSVEPGIKYFESKSILDHGPYWHSFKLQGVSTATMACAKSH